MKRFELAIAGGGLTAARAINSYREAGGGGEVVLFSEEATLPYHRPALSKSSWAARQPRRLMSKTRRSTVRFVGSIQTVPNSHWAAVIMHAGPRRSVFDSWTK